METSKFKLKTTYTQDPPVTVTLNPIFVDSVLKKYREGNIRERWDFTGIIKLFGSEAYNVKNELDVYNICRFELCDENDILITKLTSNSNKYSYYYNQNILEVGVENDSFSMGGIYENRDTYKDLSDENVNWLQIPANGSVRIKNLSSITKQISYIDSNSGHITAKNRYIFYYSQSLGGGQYEHFYVKQIAKFKPTGSLSTPVDFKDDYDTTIGQDINDQFFVCYQDHYSYPIIIQLTDLYADLTRGRVDWSLISFFNDYIEKDNSGFPQFWAKYLNDFEDNGLYPYGRLLFFDASDVKRFFSDTPATQNMSSEKEIYDIFKACFDIDYRFIPVKDDVLDFYYQYFQFKHPSENISESDIDLTNLQGNNWTDGYFKLSKDSAKIFKIQQFNTLQPNFWDKEYYTTNTYDIAQKETYNLDRIIFDIKDLIENPDKYSDDSIVIITSVYDNINDIWVCPEYSTDFPFNRPNSYMFPSLLRMFHKTYNHYKNEQATTYLDNGIDTPYFVQFNLIEEKNKQFDEMFAPINFNDVLINNNIITNIGAARLDKFEQNLDGSFSSLILVKK